MKKTFLGVVIMDRAERRAHGERMAKPNADNPTRDEILAMARVAGLSLPAEFEEELLSAYGHVARMVSRLGHSRDYAREPAHLFIPTTHGLDGTEPK